VIGTRCHLTSMCVRAPAAMTRKSHPPSDAAPASAGGTLRDGADATRRGTRHQVREPVRLGSGDERAGRTPRLVDNRLAQLLMPPISFVLPEGADGARRSGERSPTRSRARTASRREVDGAGISEAWSVGLRLVRVAPAKPSGVSTTGSFGRFRCPLVAGCPPCAGPRSGPTRGLAPHRAACGGPAHRAPRRPAYGSRKGPYGSRSDPAYGSRPMYRPCP
jgi:hypothetical protein